MILLNSNLEAFLAVSETSTVSSAAKVIGLTQAGVTQRIKSLEREIGSSLFTRSRLGMRHTYKGKLLYRKCLQAKELEGQTISELRHGGLQQDVDLILSSPAGLLSSRLIFQIADVAKRWPRLNLKLVVESGVNRRNLLKRGAVDFAILGVHEVSNEIDSKVLKPHELVLVAPSAWKGRKLEELLENERMISFRPEDTTATDYLKSYQLGALKRERLFVNDNESRHAMISLGLGFGLIPKESAPPLIKNNTLISLNGGKTLKIPFALAWYPRSEPPGYFKDMIRSIK